jgi:(1->4)-alpha-D-glucan 1-alpha-D-glucosylmutase
VLKLTVPGVPDFYQGTEIWDDSLVDPDNRRPVDFPRRRMILSEVIERPNPAEFLSEWPDGRVKLFLIHRLLKLREEMPALFSHGTYETMSATGKYRDCVIAFRRTTADHSLVVVVPRLSSRVGFPPIGEAWGDTVIEGLDVTGWQSAFGTDPRESSETAQLSQLFRDFPAAIYYR